MTYHLKIRRFDGAAALWQTFVLEDDGGSSVACALERLNNRDDLKDCDGKHAAPVAWDCGCLEKKCGACAMVISGKPRLACAVRLRDAADASGCVTLEPLKKFPCIRDLQVAREHLFDTLTEMELWLETAAAAREETRQLHYRAASCLLCGLCLEVCPQFSIRGPFGGAASALAAFDAYDHAAPGEHRNAIGRQYRRRFSDGCAKSLACQNVCPERIPIEQLLVKTNAAAVWKRGKKG